MSKIKITDDQLIRLIAREVHFLSAGFSFFDVRSNLDEPLSIFGLEEGDLLSLKDSLTDSLIDFGIEEAMNFNFDLDNSFCILDIYCLLEEFLKEKGIDILEVRGNSGII